MRKWNATDLDLLPLLSEEGLTGQLLKSGSCEQDIFLVE